MYYIFLDTSEHNIKQLRKHGFTGPRDTMAPYLCIALCEPNIYIEQLSSEQEMTMNM